MLPIDSDLNELPKWLAIKECLRSRISAGALGKEGDSFPTVRHIAAQHGVALVTAHKVVKILRDEGYIRSDGKRNVITALAGGAQRRLGFLATMPDNPFFAALARHTTEYAAARGYEVLCAYSSYDLEREKRLLNSFQRERVAGILACPADVRLSGATYSSCSIPLVFLGRKPEDNESDAVLPENFSAGQSVARHLWDCGARSFAYIGLRGYDSDPRLQGFRSGLVGLGAELADSSLAFADNLNWESAVQSVVEITHRLPRPVGLFCYHDLLASRVMRALSAQRLRIPEEIMVVGFDDLPLAAELSPALTSVSYPLQQMSELAIERILKRICGDPSPPSIHSLEPRLMIRASTGGVGVVSVAHTSVRGI